VVAGYPVWRFKRSDWIGALCCVIGWLVGLSVFVEDTQNGMVVMWLVIQLIVILSLSMMFDG